MRALVVYESQFGTTHLIAEAIGRGLAETLDVEVVDVNAALRLEGVDLLVVGGPTRGHGISSVRTRAEAPKWTMNARLDSDAGGIGVRERLHVPPPFTALAASFGTRTGIPHILSGAASDHVERRPAGHGLRSLTAPMSFLVETGDDLEHTALDRARAAIVGHTALVTSAVDALPAT
ncbi:flavodoxin domain-containing protein [Rathayibacter sp. SD072]|uniref:flavodoxin domain-containing protein n=1 Tax=Rathayibacter sp. SD072 TaxID=2781731 RepID=UPI001A958D9D|nr:flavodoxin domain-containing protein [Rathayibacter sp. SD072]MBO0983799.1 flavodoxin domain-containing protein [Rathayibacter sp. SD072]